MPLEMRIAMEIKVNRRREVAIAGRITVLIIPARLIATTAATLNTRNYLQRVG